MVTRQLPTFYLDSNVQGIVDGEHATHIAFDILNPTNSQDFIVYTSITAVNHS
jgi:hypothetical protein